jgi:uncharacterized protein YggE
MRTRSVVAATAALVIALAVVATGCGDRSASSAAVGAVAIDTVSASGTGKAYAPPDKADMSFGVSMQAPTAKQAMTQASAASDKLVAGIRAARIPSQDIQTQGVSLYPTMSPQNRVTGYQASVSVNVTVRDIKRVGPVIDTAVRAGATNIGGPDFMLSDDNEANGKAMDAAIADARRRAERMAKAAGRSVGDVLNIIESGASSPPVPMFRAAADLAGSAAAPQIEPGQLEAVSNVSVTFELK